MVGIIAFGGYVPRLRLKKAVVASAHAWFNSGLKALADGERSMANWDEDAITMAVEAARDCLDARDRSGVNRVVLASTSLPYADHQNAVVLKEALNLPDAVATMDVTSGQRAGVAALLDALYASAGGAGQVLCVASERRRARPASELELIVGDAAAALLVGTESPAARFRGAHSVSVDFVDHFRGTGEDFDYGWESRWVREEGYGKIAAQAIAQALKKFEIGGAQINHFVMAAPMKGVNVSVAKQCGIAVEAVADALSSTVGDAGTAQPLLMLSSVLERAKPGEKILVVGFGQGCDVILFEAEEQLLKTRPRVGISGMVSRGKTEANYLKFLFFSKNLDLERGMRAEFDQKPVLTALYRERKAVLGLIGGRCTMTGVVQFPKTEISIAQNARPVRTQEDYPLADRAAKVFSYTADNLTYTPDPPAYYGAVDFEGGGRLTTDFTDIDGDEVEVGCPVRMVFRIKAIDERRGFTKYFWKATPVRQ